jgi:replication factor A3
MAQEATPRILPSHLSSFTPSGRPPAATTFPTNIRLLGRVTSISGDAATLDCPTSPNYNPNNPAAQVTLHLSRDSHLLVGNAVEIVGKVNQGDLSVKVLHATDWGKAENVDWKAWEALVDATHRWKEIFYETGEEGDGGMRY